MGTMRLFAGALDALTPAQAWNPGVALDALLKRARRFAHRYTGVLWMIRAVRAMYHFGIRPSLHSAIRAAHKPRRTMPPSPLGLELGNPRCTNDTGCVSDGSIAKVAAHRIARDSHAPGTPLEPTVTRRLQFRCHALAPGGYVMAHEDDADIARLVSCSELTDVARAYLGCEPVLLACHLCVDQPNAPYTENSGVSSFHFDHAGRRSLNVFVFLTDTTPESGGHEVVCGTHRGKTLHDVLRNRLVDDEVEQRFGTRIHSIHGPAGTVTFENTEALHRRGPVRARRILLNVLFSTHRPVLSNGTLGHRLRDVPSWRRTAGQDVA